MVSIKDKMDNLFVKIQSYKGIGKPSVFHALVVIFAEFAVWGLLTGPTINALKQSFPGQTLMSNGIIWGIKGTLSFLMSPPIGFMSDIYGRKPFLLITVVFTCLPVPFLFISSRWFFYILAFSGLFAVTFSVVFAYVADITSGQKMAKSYGQVAATFAASLIITPALGAHLSKLYESLGEKVKPAQSSLWERTDFITTIRKIGKDMLIWTICLAVFLSYLPEAGQYSCFFVYLKLVINFNEEDIAIFIALLGTLSVLAQTLLLTHLIEKYGGKRTIMFGLSMQGLQLLLLGFCRSYTMMWVCGIIASLSSITYPAISAYISTYADSNKQGLVQGLISAVRSLCGGVGPAMFGLIFYLYDVDISDESKSSVVTNSSSSAYNPKLIPNQPSTNYSQSQKMSESWLGKIGVVGPPFLYGSFFVGLAMLVIAGGVPDTIMPYRRPSSSKASSQTNYYHYTSVMVNGNGETSTTSNLKKEPLSASRCELLSGDIED